MPYPGKYFTDIKIRASYPKENQVKTYANLQMSCVEMQDLSKTLQYNESNKTILLVSGLHLHRSYTKDGEDLDTISRLLLRPHMTFNLWL
jgi:hypothetical protein